MEFDFWVVEYSNGLTCNEEIDYCQRIYKTKEKAQEDYEYYLNWQKEIREKYNAEGFDYVRMYGDLFEENKNE